MADDNMSISDMGSVVDSASIVLDVEEGTTSASEAQEEVLVQEASTPESTCGELARGVKRKSSDARNATNNDTEDGSEAEALAGAGRKDGQQGQLDLNEIPRWSRAQGRAYLGLTEKEGEQTWSEPFLFACLADTQLGAMNDNEDWGEEIELCRKAVERLNSLKPKFAIVCGDLVNHMPSMYPNTDPEIRTRQVNDFKEVMGCLDPSIPLLCVCGNHDVGNAPSHVTVQRYVSEFGDDYYGFWVGGVRGLVINSNLYYDPSQAKDLYDKQHAWLSTEMAASKAQGATHIVLFAHHPLFLVRDDEDEDTDVLGFLTFSTRKGEDVRIPNTYFHLPRERRDTLLSLMQEHGCSHVFCGHWHKNGVVRSDKYGVENVITSALGLQLGPDQSGLRLVKVFEDAIVHRYFALPDVPSSVALDPTHKQQW